MDELKKEVEKLKDEAIALKQQNEREYKNYGAKITGLSANVQALTKDKENLEEYLAGKVVGEKNKLKEVQEKEIKQLNKANELVNESSAKRQDADKIIDDASKLLLKANTDINIKLSNIKLKEEAVLIRSKNVSDKESWAKSKLTELDARDKQQDFRSTQLHKESHDGVKRLKEIIIKEKLVDKNLKAIEAKRKEAQKALRDNNLVLEQIQKVRKDIGEKKYIISGKEELIANKEKKLEEEQRKVSIASAGVKATIIKLDARRENLNKMYKKFKEGGN